MQTSTRSRRSFRSLLVLPVAFVLALLGGCGTEETATAPFTGDSPLAGSDLTSAPNILLIVADDLGYSDVSTYGGEIRTPNIDALAESGLRFTNFHVASSCAPTRAMLLTGVDNHLAGQGSMTFLAANQRGRPGYEDRLNERVVSVATLLRDAGYHTYMAGKWHLGKKAGQRPADRGFERSFALLGGAESHYPQSGPPRARYYADHEPAKPPEDYYSTDYYTDRLIEFIDGGEDGRPFFAYAAYTAPHWPLQAPESLIEQYLDVYAKGWDVLRTERFARQRGLGLPAIDIALPPRAPGVPAWSDLDPERRRIEAKKMAIYAAMVEHLDTAIGRLIGHLRERGRLDDTVVLFMSDNGADSLDPETSPLAILRHLMTLRADNAYDNMGRPGSFVTYGAPWANLSSTPLSWWKGTAAEGGLRVPLIVSLPRGAMKGGTSDAFTHVTDLVPTLLDLAGLIHPGSPYRGRTVYVPTGPSLLPLVEGRATTLPRAAAGTGFELFAHRALYRDGWKLLSLPPPFGETAWALYDLNRDPAEQDDLAAREPERVRAMREAWEEFATDVGVVPAPAGYDLFQGDIGIVDQLRAVLAM